MWTSGERVCANEQCCGQTANWESRSWTSSVHSQRSTVAHKLFFKPAPVDRQQLMESDSLAQDRIRTLDTRPRCDLPTNDTSESEKARDLVLVTPRVRNCDCSCRRVNESHPLGEGKRRATEAPVP